MFDEAPIQRRDFFGYVEVIWWVEVFYLELVLMV